MPLNRETSSIPTWELSMRLAVVLGIAGLRMSCLSGGPKKVEWK